MVLQALDIEGKILPAPHLMVLILHHKMNLNQDPEIPCSSEIVICL